jgi:acetate kinase
MKVLVINTGSSSLKYQLFTKDCTILLASGNIEEIGSQSATITHKSRKQGSPFKEFEHKCQLKDHHQSVEMILGLLIDGNKENGIEV